MFLRGEFLSSNSLIDWANFYVEFILSSEFFLIKTF